MLTGNPESTIADTGSPSISTVTSIQGPPSSQLAWTPIVQRVAISESTLSDRPADSALTFDDSWHDELVVVSLDSFRPFNGQSRIKWPSAPQL